MWPAYKYFNMPNLKYEITVTCLPKGIKDNLESLFTGHKYNTALKLVDTIYRTHYMYPNRELDAWVPLSTSYIYRVVTRKNSNILIKLISNGILERSGVASAKLHRTYKYRFAKKYWQAGKEQIKYNKPLNNVYKINDSLIQYCKDNLKLITLPIGMTIDDMIALRMPQINKSAQSKANEKLSVEELVNRTVSMERISLDDIVKGNSRATRSATNNRMDHNLTNISNSYLNNMLFDSQPILSIDLVNSQSVILANLICKCLDGDTIDNHEFCNIINDKLTIPRCIMYPPCPTDIQLFNEAAFNGKLYSYIMQKAGYDSISTAKKATFEAIYSTIGLYKESSSKLNFRKIFPDLTAIIDEYKNQQIVKQKEVYLKDRSNYKLNNKGRSYSQRGSSELAILLQKEEARIFIDSIYSELKQMKIPSLPKHDSLILPLSQKDAVLSLMMDKLSKELPYGYSLKIELAGKTIDKITPTPVRQVHMDESDELVFKGGDLLSSY